MACAHVRRCPNWQCWWDEDSVVAASGLTEDDERNLQADKMRSKARARKLAKSRCSLFRFLPLFCRRAPKLLRLLYMSTCVLVICHILKRGGGDSFCPELTFPLKMLSRLRLAPRPLSPARCGLGSGASRRHKVFMCDEKNAAGALTWSRSLAVMVEINIGVRKKKKI